MCGDDADEVIRYFGVTAQGNFVDPHTDFRGNILHVADRNEPHAAKPCVRQLAQLARAPRDAGPPRPRRQGAARVERALPRRAHRSGGRARPRRLDGRGAHERAFLLRELRTGRRPAPPLVAGAVPRVRRGLRRAPRGAPHARRARRRRVARRGARRRRRAAAALPRPRRRRILHDGPRRRAARRPAEGRVRRRDAVGELARRERAAPPRHAHRRQRSYEAPAVAILEMLAGPMAQHPTGFAYAARRARALRARPDRDRDRRRPRRRPHARAAAPRSPAGSCPRRSRSPAPAADAAIPLLADRPRARRADGVRVRALRVPGTGDRRPTRCARRSTPRSRRGRQ